MSRVVPVAEVVGHSALLELTFHHDAFQPPPVASTRARAWTRLRNLRSALADAADLTPQFFFFVECVLQQRGQIPLKQHRSHAARG